MGFSQSVSLVAVLSSREVADGQKPLGERIADAAMRALQLWRINPDFGHQKSNKLNDKTC